MLGTRALATSFAKPEALKASEHAHKHGFEVHPMTLVSRTPGADICDVARVKGATLIIMGWHKPVFNQAMLGGNVQQVMKGGTADVAVSH